MQSEPLSSPVTTKAAYIDWPARAGCRLATYLQQLVPQLASQAQKQHEFADNFWKDVKVRPLCEVEGVWPWLVVRQVFVAAVPGRNR